MVKKNLMKRKFSDNPIYPICPINPMGLIGLMGKIINRRNAFPDIFLNSIFGISLMIILSLFSFSATAEEAKPAEDYLNKSYKYQNPAGEYLVNGGMGFEIIHQKTMGEKFSEIQNEIYGMIDEDMRSKDSPKENYEFWGFRSSERTQISFFSVVEKGALKSFYYDISQVYGADFGKTPTMIQIPSSTTKGDWDLVSSMMIKIPEPVKSYYHHVNDPLIIKYYNELYNYKQKMQEIQYKNLSITAEINTQIYKDADMLISRNPDDYFIRTIYYDSLIRRGEFDKLKKDLDEHQAFYTTTEISVLKNVYDKCRLIIYAKELSDSGKNGWDVIKKFQSRKTNYEERLKILPEIIKYSEYAKLPDGLISNEIVPNFLEMQVFSKTIVIESYFRMLQGKKDDSLLYLSSVFTIGNVFCTSNSLIEQLIGTAIKAISTHALDIQVKNFCETPEDVTKFSQQIEVLNSKLVKSDKMNENLSSFGQNSENSNTLEYFSRIKTAEAKFQNLRLTGAAKKSLVETKSFPVTDDYIKNLFKDKFPEDPFSGGPMKYIAGKDEYVFYSVGPDNIDNKAVFDYDPTNGSVSAGDIISKIPAKRKYPFPAKGLKANSKEEVEKIFPNGLPRDNFADTIGRGLNITNTKPVKIYSYGPDTDEGIVLKSGENYTPEVKYDPTNGTVSNGDLIWEVPGIENHKDTETQRKGAGNHE